MGDFRAKLRKFKAEGDPYWGPKEIRIEYMRAFARRANRNIVPVPAEWWTVPMETMTSPGMIYQTTELYGWRPEGNLNWAWNLVPSPDDRS